MWSVKCEVWGLECEGSSEKWEVRSVKCGLWSVKCEVWSVKFEVWSAKSAVWSVECGVWRLGFVSRWKKAACRGKDTVGTGCLRTIYRSFIFGKLPPPACPGTSILYIYIYLNTHTHIQYFFSNGCFTILILGNLLGWFCEFWRSAQANPSILIVFQ